MEIINKERYYQTSLYRIIVFLSWLAVLLFFGFMAFLIIGEAINIGFIIASLLVGIILGLGSFLGFCYVYWLDSYERLFKYIMGIYRLV